jgi:hypothetical protein
MVGFLCCKPYVDDTELVETSPVAHDGASAQEVSTVKATTAQAGGAISHDIISTEQQQQQPRALSKATANSEEGCSNSTVSSDKALGVTLTSMSSITTGTSKPSTITKVTEASSKSAAEEGVLAELSAADVAQAYGVPESAILTLREQFPESPFAEIGRYLARNSADGCPKKAAPLLKTYLEWRKKELAFFPPPPPNLPMHVNMLGKAKDGTQLLHFLSTSIDPAFSAEVHGQAMLSWLDRNLPRESTMRLTVLFDVRGHQGLQKNKNIFDIWRHAFHLPKLFQTHCPERLTRVIIYPVDEVARTAWSFIKNLVSPVTAKRVVFLPGSSKLGSPSPPELLEYIDVSQIPADSRRFFARLPGIEE